MILLTGGVVKSIHTESRMVDARGWSMVEIRSKCSTDTGLLFGVTIF